MGGPLLVSVFAFHDVARRPERIRLAVHHLHVQKQLLASRAKIALNNFYIVRGSNATLAWATQPGAVTQSGGGGVSIVFSPKHMSAIADAVVLDYVTVVGVSAAVEIIARLGWKRFR